MKIIFKVFGLSERQIVLDAWLSSTGVEKETEMITYRTHLINCKDKLQAIEYVTDYKQNIHNFEHGFEIVETIND